MKTIDVSRSVMTKVAVYEKQAITVWLRNFMIFMLSFGAAVVVVILAIARDLLEKRTFDVFELFFQDPEIISEFWKEVFVTFWDEVPQNLIIIAGIMFGLLLFVLFATRVKRAVIRRKMLQLDKYS